MTDKILTVVGIAMLIAVDLLIAWAFMGPVLR